jgi:hypothetical protein
MSCPRFGAHEARHIRSHATRLFHPALYGRPLRTQLKLGIVPFCRSECATHIVGTSVGFLSRRYSAIITVSTTCGYS